MPGCNIKQSKNYKPNFAHPFHQVSPDAAAPLCVTAVNPVASFAFVNEAPVNAGDPAAGLKSTELSYLNGAVKLTSVLVANTLLALAGRLK